MTKKQTTKNNNKKIQKKKVKDPNQLTFIEHAQDFRKRIMLSFIVIIVFFVILIGEVLITYYKGSYI